MHKNAGKTVAEVLRTKKASLKDAPLEIGAPAWNQIMHLTWEEISVRAQASLPGYKTIKKLLGSREYDK